jgi:Uma2 family endonuclease
MAAGSSTPTTPATGFAAPVVSSTSASAPTVPRLEQGDRLTRAEFERRYDAMPDLKKAELIEGIVHMPSPVSFARHGNPHWHLVTWLGTYEAHTAGVTGGDNSSLRFDNDNMPQPDALLMIKSECGGQAAIDADGYVAGPPELVAEVASTSASYDLHDKRNIYRRSGVREYVVWRVLDEAIDWFVLRDGEYRPLGVGEDGVFRSEVFPGLWLAARAMLEGKLDAVLATLQQGIATPEHQDFVAELERQRNQRSSESASAPR